jgi:DNA-binding transcriptional ArsR family regulator
MTDNSAVMVEMHSGTDILFTALADPTRRGIFQRLAREGEHTVHALTDLAGVSQPAVSKHLAVLAQAGLVARRRDGRETHYRIRQEGLVPLLDWLSVYGAFWQERLDALERTLKEMDT